MEKVTGYGSRVTVTGGRDLVGGAVLKIEKGKRTDLQFHINTTKAFYVLSGKIKVNIMKDAMLQALEAPAGNAFAVNKGLVYQMEGLEDSVVVEFLSSPSNYLVVDGKTNEDVTVIARGTQLEEEKKASDVVKAVNSIDNEALKEKLAKAVEAKAEETKKPASKKTTKKTTRKKTSKKKTN